MGDVIIAKDAGMYNILRCPRCGGENLHHHDIEVFNRTEDSKDGTHVKVGWDTVQVNRDLQGNPSDRRHGLTIVFSCETCSAQQEAFVLSISQHKGNTLLEFSEIGD